MTVRLNWKILRLTLSGGFLVLTAGCSGINASKSVSPLDFLLPGAGHFMHMQNTPPSQAVPGTNCTFAALQPSTSLAQSPQ
jgi:hypothetical protein